MNVRSNATEAMKRLGLHRKFNATLLQDDRTTMGMLRAASAFVAWYKIDRDTLLKILKERARVSSEKRLTEQGLKSLGFRSFEELADALLDGKVKWSKLEGVKHTFNLSPPRGGFDRKITKFYGAGGILAENPELPQLVERMI